MATYDPERHRRRSIRLAGYDYGQPGSYFVTISSYQNRSLFGEIAGGMVILNEYGRLVEEEWQRTSLVRTGIILDEYVVMPNHLHGVVIIETEQLPGEEVGPDRVLRSPSQTLGAIVRGFKSASTRRINAARDDTDVSPVWHRNYYEHIVRNEADLNRIRAYIAANPANWQHDRNHPNS